jgi:hypothetical protein
MMGRADYYAEGQYNFRCQECGQKLKSSLGRRRWDGFWVGPECWEIRNPQDFVRGIPDRQAVPWSTGDPPPVFINDTSSPTTTQDYPMLLDAYFLGSRLLG